MPRRSKVKYLWFLPLNLIGPCRNEAVANDGINVGKVATVIHHSWEFLKDWLPWPSWRLCIELLSGVLRLAGVNLLDHGRNLRHLHESSVVTLKGTTRNRHPRQTFPGCFRVIKLCDFGAEIFASQNSESPAELPNLEDPKSSAS